MINNPAGGLFLVIHLPYCGPACNSAIVAERTMNTRLRQINNLKSLILRLLICLCLKLGRMRLTERVPEITEKKNTGKESFVPDNCFAGKQGFETMLKQGLDYTISLLQLMLQVSL